MFDTTTNQIPPINKGKKDYLNERRISIYNLRCEGRRIAEITNMMNVSERTVFRDLAWCHKHLKREFSPEILDDFIFDSYRRRTLIWSKIKELARSTKPITHIIAASKHLSELESKIVDFSKTAKLISPDTEKTDLNNLLHKLEVHLRTMPDGELQDFVNNGSESSEHDETLDSPQNTDEKNDNTPDS